LKKARQKLLKMSTRVLQTPPAQNQKKFFGYFFSKK